MPVVNEEGVTGLPSFASDYMEGAHPQVIEAVSRLSREHNAGYGLDPHSERARELIRKACQAPGAEIYFLVGGTQTNATVIDALLKSYEGVIAATTGHVSTHEAGAIEFYGHKVIELAGREGKLDAAQVDGFCQKWEADDNRDHMVMPRLVYLSQPTELGTLYSEAELETLRAVCDAHELLLYVDGARLASALASPQNDVTLADLARLCDAFYIGGTKCGCLFGEAVVFPRPGIAERFFTISKQHGALLAKGFVTGAQYETLFEDGLYGRICKPAITGARRICAALEARGIGLSVPCPTNQIFVTVADSVLPWLDGRVVYGMWEKADATHTTIRFCTSWATTPEDVDALVRVIEAMPLA